MSLPESFLKPSPQSILGRVYRYWADHDRNGWKYLEGRRPENLCHFVRVVVFWSFVTWLYYQPLGHRNIRPWMLLALGASGLGYYLNPRITVWVLAAVGVVAITVGTLLILMEYGHKIARPVGLGVIALTAPVWAPVIAVMDGWDSTKHYDEKEATHFRYMYVVGLVLSGLILSFMALGKEIVKYLIAMGIAAILLVIAFFVFYTIVLIIEGIVQMMDRRSVRKSKPIYHISGDYSHGWNAAVGNEPKRPSNFRVFWTWLKAQKRRICPFVDVTGLASNKR
jgi:dipeptide/tripeptide permease